MGAAEAESWSKASAGAMSAHTRSGVCSRQARELIGAVSGWIATDRQQTGVKAFRRCTQDKGQHP